MQALGYDMNSMEWAIRDGVPYAIDFMNPAPDMDVNSLTPHYFEWVVQKMADMAIRLATEPRPQLRELRWNQLLAAPLPDLEPGAAWPDRERRSPPPDTPAEAGAPKAGAAGPRPARS